MSSCDPKGRKRCHRWLVAALCVIASPAVVPARAIEPVATDQPIVFKADEVTYDSRNKITRATGNVEAVQAGRRVVADTVVYDEVRTSSPRKATLRYTNRRARWSRASRSSSPAI